MSLLIGVRITLINGKEVRCAYEPERARFVIDYAAGSSLVKDWSFYDPKAEPETGVDFDFIGGDHKRQQKTRS